MVWIYSADYFKSLFIPILSAMDSHGLWRNRFVYHGQLWLVKQNVFSTLDSYGRKTLRERLRTPKVFTKYQFFYLNYHKFSIKSYVLDVF